MFAHSVFLKCGLIKVDYSPGRTSVSEQHSINDSIAFASPGGERRLYLGLVGRKHISLVSLLFANLSLRHGVYHLPYAFSPCRYTSLEIRDVSWRVKDGK